MTCLSEQWPHWFARQKTRSSCNHFENSIGWNQRHGNVHRKISSWLQFVTDRIWNKAKILSFAYEKIRFLLTCFFYFCRFRFISILCSDVRNSVFSRFFFICTWYLFDVSIWILLFPVIIRLYLGRGTNFFFNYLDTRPMNNAINA